MSDKYDSGDAAAERDFVSESDDAYEPWAESEWGRDVYLHDLFGLVQLEAALEQGYVRRQKHPKLPLSILNYTEKCAYERAWNPVTLQCRGLIYETKTLRVVARPFPKFFNHGEPSASELDLDAPAVVIDKMDGSLGILYPHPCLRCNGSGDEPFDDEQSQNRFVKVACDECKGSKISHSISTRGSFASEQAIHATAVYRARYADWTPDPSLTYLFEIIYPSNRVVLDYGATDDLFLLAALEIATGAPVEEGNRFGWPGPDAEVHAYATLAEALAAEPRPNAEGYVVYFPDLDQRVKVKQSDYVALHRILTGTNARHVYEFAAVRACSGAITRLADGRNAENLWGSFVGLDPVRVEQLQAAGDGWLEATGIPDEFYDWVRGVVDAVEAQAGQSILAAIEVANRGREITDRRERYEYVRANAPASLTSETMRLASGGERSEFDRLICRAWRESAPEPTAPFQRSEAVA